MTEPTTDPTPTDEMVERVARALEAEDRNGYEDTMLPWEAVDEHWRVAYRRSATAAITALAPELNRADLTVRAFALTVTNAKQAGKRTVPVEELEKVVADPMRVVMK